MKSQHEPYYVFFDVDGTILQIKSMFSFLKFYMQYEKYLNRLGRFRYHLYMSKVWLLEKIAVNREFLNAIYYENFKGCDHQQLQQSAWHWFERLKFTENFYHTKVIEHLRWHQQQNAGIVLVSGSFTECLQPLAAELNIKHILATQLEVIGGKCTGKIIPPQTIGVGKMQVIEQFLKDKDPALKAQCYAYGDHISDLPMLESVGHPHVIPGDNQLENYARYCQWPILTTMN